jgi:hypothetical protein
MSDVAVEVLTGGVQVELPATATVQVEVVPSSTPAFEVSTVATGNSGSAAYVHTQSTPSAEWIINHNRGVQLGAVVFSPGGLEVTAEVIAVSLNQTRVLFALPTPGTARLS